MAQAKGSRGQVVIDFETTYGSDPVAADGILMPINTFSLQAKRNQIIPATITGTRNPVMPIDGNNDCSGGAVVPVDAINFGYWLRALLGVPDTTGALAPYTHVFSVPLAVESMVVDLGYTDVGQYFKFNGAKLSSMAIDFGGDAELVANLEFMAAKSTLTQAAYDTPTGLEFIRFGQFQLAVEEGGAPSTIVGTVNLTISNNLDPNSYVIGGGGIRGDLPEGVVAVSGTLRALFTDEVLYEKALDSTETSLKITADNTVESIEFYLPELKFTPATPVLVNGGIWAELPFAAYYSDNVGATAFQVTLINSHEAYVAS
jgi:hypothetical protein